MKNETLRGDIFGTGSMFEVVVEKRVRIESSQLGVHYFPGTGKTRQAKMVELESEGNPIC
jgi:hypothetical protein